MDKYVQILLLLYCGLMASASQGEVVLTNSTIEVRVDSSLILVCNGRTSDRFDESSTWIWRIRQNNESYILPKTKDRNLIFKNVQFNDTGRYECSNTGQSYSSWINLLVGEPPDRPQDLYCITHYSFSYTKCCWDIGRSTRITTNYTLKYVAEQGVLDTHTRKWNTTKTNGSCSSIQSGQMAKKISSKCCDLPIEGNPNNRDEIVQFSIQLISENSLGTAKYKNSELENPLSWVKPLTPTNITLQIRKKTNIYLINANWNPPNMTSTKFEYSLRYRISRDETTAWHIIERIPKQKYTFQIRRSHSLVQVQVSAKPVGLIVGPSSEWSNSAFISTGDIPPMSTLRFNEITTDISSDTGPTIAVEWAKYARQDEPGFYYRIIYTYCNQSVFASYNFTASQTTHIQSVNISDCISISGTNCNNVGCSETTNAQVFPSEVPKYNFSVELNVLEDDFILNWNYMKNSYEDCRINIFETSRLQVNETSFAVRKIIASENVLCTKENIQISKSSSMCKEYVGVVSAIKRHNDVTYARTVTSSPETTRIGNLSNIENLEVNFTSYPAQLQASWSLRETLNCTSYLQPRISYTAVDGAECQGFGRGCKREYFSEAVGCNAITTNITDNIYGDTVYEARMGMCCPSDTSHHTHKPICHFHKNEEAVVYRTPISAPGPPTNFQWNKKDKDDVLSWSMPLHPNGPISGYRISVNSGNDSAIIRNISTDNSNVKHSDICEKDIHTRNVNITAYTINEADEVVLYGESMTFMSVECDIGQLIHRDSVPVIIGSTVGILLVIISALVVYYHKKHIKNIITRTIWPSVPRPNVIVTFQRINTSNEHVINFTFDEAQSNQDIREENFDEIRAPLLPESEINHQTRQPSTPDQNNSNAREENPAGIADSSHIHTEGRARQETANQCQYNRNPDQCEVPNLSATFQQNLENREQTILSPKSSAGCPHSYIKTTEDFQNQTELQFYNSSLCGGMSRSIRHGSTPSIPSYLSCSTNYPFSISTARNNSDVGSVYARLPDMYQWTLPDYTAFSVRSTYSDYSWTKLPQTSTPFDLRTGCRIFFDDVSPEKKESNIQEVFQAASYSGFSQK
ncbi:uncharacterized protein LOC120347278 isoform X1 [Styela clava]